MFENNYCFIVAYVRIIDTNCSAEATIEVE